MPKAIKEFIFFLFFLPFSYPWSESWIQFKWSGQYRRLNKELWHIKQSKHRNLKCWFGVQQMELSVEKINKRKQFQIFRFCKVNLQIWREVIGVLYWFYIYYCRAFWGVLCWNVLIKFVWGKVWVIKNLHTRLESLLLDFQAT